MSADTPRPSNHLPAPEVAAASDVFTRASDRALRTWLGVSGVLLASGGVGTLTGADWTRQVLDAGILLLTILPVAHLASLIFALIRRREWPFVAMGAGIVALLAWLTLTG